MFCAMDDSLEKAIGRPEVLQRAEQMLPGACATLMLTIAETHLLPLQPGRLAAAGHPLLSSECAVLSASRPELENLPESVWQVVYLMLPAAARYTVALADSRPCALRKKCLLAALLKTTAVFTSAMLQIRKEENSQAGLVMDLAETALMKVLESCSQLALHFEQLLVQQLQQHQEQHRQMQQGADVPAALANCLAMYGCTLLAPLIFDGANAKGCLREYSKLAMKQLQKLLQLHDRSLQRVIEAPLCMNSPWPLICTAGGQLAMIDHRVRDDAMPIEAAVRKYVEEGSERRGMHMVKQIVETTRQLSGEGAKLSAAQRVALAQELLALCIFSLGLVPSLELLEQAGRSALSMAAVELLTFSKPGMIALAAVQDKLQQFLAAEDNVHMLSEPLPVAFLAHSNGMGGSIGAELLPAVPTWRMILALAVQQCSSRILSAIYSALHSSHVGVPMPTHADMLALLAATAAWPLGASLVGAPEGTGKWDFMTPCWIAADMMLSKLSDEVDPSASPSRMPWQSAPDELAGCTVALLAFAQYAGMLGTEQRHSALLTSRPMQVAHTAAAWLRANPTAVTTPGPPPNDVPDTAALVRLLGWLAQPTTPVATASAVLAEALPALEHRVRSRPPMRQLLAEAGGRWEWAPVAAALHRRMAARFLSEVDCVTAAVADSSENCEGAADTRDAIASLQLVRHYAPPPPPPGKISCLPDLAWLMYGVSRLAT